MKFYVIRSIFIHSKVVVVVAVCISCVIFIWIIPAQVPVIDSYHFGPIRGITDLYLLENYKTHNGFDKEILRINAGTLSSKRLYHWFHEMLLFSNHQKHFTKLFKHEVSHKYWDLLNILYLSFELLDLVKGRSKGIWSLFKNI